MNARTCAAKRRRDKAYKPSRTAGAPGDDLTWREVQQVLHAELNRLPERHRAPLVHCYLEGKSQDEAARLLGVSRPALKKRLEAGRALLRTRLVRRGLGPAAVLAVSAWPSAKAAALIPLTLADSTVKAAGLIGAGEAVKGLISPNVLALAEGVLKAMFLTKLKLVSAVLLTVLVGAGLVGWSYQATAQTGTGASQGQTVGPLFATGQSSSQGQTVAGNPTNPTQGGSAAPAERPAADELDALRLEIDALRKEVRATRERVRVLEAEVHRQKEKVAVLGYDGHERSTVLDGHRNAAGGGGNQPQAEVAGPQGKDAVAASGANQSKASNGRSPLRDSAGSAAGKSPAASSGGTASTASKDENARDFFLYRAKLRWTTRSSDYLAEAEAALNRLRQNPHDKQAAEALKRATQRLTEQAVGEGNANHNSPAKGH
jgi:Sigma-70, region 4